MTDITQNGIITIVRGDDFSKPLFLNGGTEEKPLHYKINDKDEIYFAIMEYNQPFEHAIIKKAFNIENVNEHGDVIIEITHDDTRCLLPGKYFYQIKARLYNTEKDKYEVNTVCQKTQLIIEE